MSDSSITANQKLLVAERANYCCEYCLSQVIFSPDPFCVDHIDPRTEGGTDASENLAYSCLGCNGHKFTATTAIDPITGQTVALYHPRQDAWHENFTWSDDFTLIIGLTPTGRATIERLKLNRSGVLNLRELLTTTDRHPPY